MTKENRVKISILISILVRARSLIQQGKEEYVCLAIEEASGGWHAARRGIDRACAGADLIKEINEAFVRAGVPQSSPVESWLTTVHGVDRDLMTPSRMRDYRVRWLTQWIHDLEHSIDKASMQ